MDQQFTFKLELPQEVLDTIETLIVETIQRELTFHVQEIRAQHRLLTRAEVREKLRITYPTLLAYERKGFIKGQRIGRRVLFSGDEIDAFLNGQK